MVNHGYVLAVTAVPPIMRLGSFSGNTLAGCSFSYNFLADARECMTNFVSNARERVEIFIVDSSFAFFVSSNYVQYLCAITMETSYSTHAVLL